MTLHSCIFKGSVRHARREPRHEFKYPLYMLYLDLAELPKLVQENYLSHARFAPISLQRRDYFGAETVPLAISVRERVSERLGFYPTGRICMLTHPRYFGLCFNPVTFYYCFDTEERLTAVLAEINNTPWNERHQYVLPVNPEQSVSRHDFSKTFHVSPFFPMDMSYQWQFSSPKTHLNVHMRNLREGKPCFDASLTMERLELSKANLNTMMWRHPLITWRVVFHIYYQAMLLWLKKAPFYTHPSKLNKYSEVPVETTKP